LGSGTADRKVPRRTAFSARDYLTLLLFGALWLWMTIRGIQLVVAVPRWWGAELATTAFFTWFCWVCVTYRRAALYVAPFLGLVALMAGAMEAVFHYPERTAKLLLTASVVGVVWGVLFVRRKSYS